MHIGNVLGRTDIIHAFTALSFIALLMVVAKTRYTLPLFILLGIFVALDVFFAIFFGERLTVGLMASIMDTNPGEIQGAVKNMLIWGAPILISTFGLMYSSKEELKKNNISRSIPLVLFSVYWLLVVPICCFYYLQRIECWREEMKLSKIYTLYYTTSYKFPLIYNNVLAFAVYLDTKNDFSSYADADRRIPVGITYDSDQDTPEKIYLVLGESARRDHLSLYGYNKKTTPFLDSLAQDTIRMKYYDGISCATLTREVISLSLSFAYPRNFTFFNQSRNLLEVMQDANYKTYWISSQPRVGTHESYVSAVAATADFSYHEKKYPAEDLELVDMLQDELEKGKKQFFILHLDGSHIWYPDKYDEIDAKAIKGSDDDVTHYDRTIHHTDRVLRKLYDVIERDGSNYVMLYISDHGEIIGLGHSFRAEDTGNLDIPFVTINNSDIPLDSIIDQYFDPELNVINNTNIINIVSQIGGYKK